MTHTLSLAVLSISCCLLTACASDAPQTATAGGSNARAPGAPSRSPDLRSDLGIPAAQEFLFAGGDTGRFSASATNRGDTTIEIFADRNGVRTAKATLKPGEAAFAAFEPGEAAIFVNTSTTGDAQCRLLVWGSTDVAMRYRDWLTGVDR